MGSVWEGDGVDDVPPSLFRGIWSFMLAASEDEALNPRVAYLCRLHALEKAGRLDPTSRGRGVPEFKTALLQRLERDDLQTLEGRMHSSDAREMLCFYREFNSKYEQALRTAKTTGKDEDAALDERALLLIMRATETALFEVLNGVFSRADQEHELSKPHKDVILPALRRRRRGTQDQEHVVRDVLGSVVLEEANLSKASGSSGMTFLSHIFDHISAKWSNCYSGFF